MKNVRSLGFDALLNMSDAELSSLTTSQRRIVMERLANTANKRLSRLRTTESKYGESMAVNSPAFQQLRNRKQGDRPFTISGRKLGLSTYKKGGKTRFKGYGNALLKEIKSAIRFLKDKTSTIAGTKELIKGFEDMGLVFDSNAQARSFWEAYNKILELNPTIPKKGTAGRKITTDMIQALIYERMFPGLNAGMDVDSVIKAMNDYLNEEYKKSENENQEQSPLSIPGKRKRKGKPDFSINFETIYPLGKKPKK